ncbi:MAG TPA: hypothetical protein VFW65_36285 [Pseudonocardiaceae bacterium]|nr:hypothetical protein [Pseudonocardiaceae bacterium]
MEYQLTAEVDPPAGTPALDALQRHGVAALLDENLEMLADIEGPDGVEIEPLDHRISVQPDGASITWVLDAPALAFAEDAARHVLGELLERTELLTDWSVRRCEVTASDEDLAAALAGADGAGGEDVEIEINLDSIAELADSDTDERREQLLDAAGELGAFGYDAFGFEDDEDGDTSGDEDGDRISEEAAELVAGALMTGLDVLTDELFADVQTLEDSGSTAGEQEVLWALHALPARFAAHYTAQFAKKFLVTTAVLGYRLTQPEWDGPRSLAEALAIRLVKEAARHQLDLAGLLDELPLARMFEVFDEYALEGVDIEDLYADVEIDEDDETDLDDFVLADWFEPLEVDEPDAAAPVDHAMRS